MQVIEIYFLLPLIIMIVMGSISVTLNSKKTIGRLNDRGIQINIGVLNNSDILRLDELILIQLREKVIQTTISIVFMTAIVGFILLLSNTDETISAIVCIGIQLIICIVLIIPLLKKAKDIKCY